MIRKIFKLSKNKLVNVKIRSNLSYQTMTRIVEGIKEYST